MEDDGDAMAEAQLALLYKLGVLTQDAGEEQCESENDMFGFLNRMLPPPPFRFDAASSETSSRQTSGEGGAASSRESMMSPYAPVRPYVMPRVTSDRSESRSAFIHRMPLSPLSVSSLRSEHRQVPRKQNIEFSETRSRLNQVDTSDRGLKRWCFDKWKSHCCDVWRCQEADHQGRMKSKRRFLRHWQAMVHKARLEEARCKQLMFWKLKRKVTEWKAWAVLHRRVGWVLSGHHYRFWLMSRLRRERAWKRWRAFVRWNERYRAMTNKASIWRCLYTRRRCWIEWRIIVLMEKRKKSVYGTFFEGVRLLRRERMSRMECVSERHQVQLMKHAKRLYHRWWLFTVHCQHERKRAWQVQMILSRGRLFTIWYNTMGHLRKIMPTRERVMQRIKCEHFHAWRAAVAALQLSRTSTLWHPEAIQARYLAVWVRWTMESVRLRSAQQLIEDGRKRRGIRLLRLWSTEHGQYSRMLHTADGISRQRILTFVWEEGLMAYHSKRKEGILRIKSVQALRITKVFHTWRNLWLIRHQWKAKKHTASRMALTSKIRHAWGGWIQYLQWRQSHRSQLATASTHYATFMKLRGLVVLSYKPGRKSANQLAMRQIRMKFRTSLKRRAFYALKTLIQQTKTLERKLQAFTLRPSFTRSTLNPLRRMWTTWTSRVSQRMKIREINHQRAVSVKMKTLLLWKKHIHHIMRCRTQLVIHQCRFSCAVFSAWRSWIESRHQRRGSDLVARKFFKQSVAKKMLGDWKRTSSQMRCTRQRGSQIHTWSSHRVEKYRFKLWRQHFLQRIGARKLEEHRRFAWLQLCWDAWCGVHKRCSIQKRKLIYFRRVFGQYPYTSPLQRFWSRWREWNNCQVAVKKMRKKRDTGLIQRCWNAFKIFGSARIMLREWHKASLISAAESNDLGRRYRIFREKRTHRRLVHYFNRWVTFTMKVHQKQEELSKIRKNMLKDLGATCTKRRNLMRWRVRLWFRRWRCHQLVSLHQAVDIYWRRLGKRVLREWWRHVIHCKQERLLSGARQTLGLLSAHKGSHKAQQRLKFQASQNLLGRTPQAKSVVRQSVAKSHSSGVMVDTLPRTNSYSIQFHRVNEKARAKLQPRFQKPKISQTRTMEDICQAPDTPGVNSRARQRNTKPSLQEELPLYDKDLISERRCVDTTTVSTVDHNPNRPTTHHLVADDDVLSLESIVAMNPYSPGKRDERCRGSPALDSIRHGGLNRSYSRSTMKHIHQESPASATQPALFTPEQSLQPEQPRGRPFRPPRQQSSAQRRDDTNKNLADILGVPVDKAVPHSAPSFFRSALRDMIVENTRDKFVVDVDSAINMIVGHYVSRPMCSTAQDSETYLQTWGFCLLRDLALFANGYFISAMERSIDHVSASSFNAQDRHGMLKKFLNVFLTSHPAYQSARTKTESTALSWLIKKHLALRVGSSISRALLDPLGPQSSWILNPLPDEVIQAIPKLLKCFKKYQKPLEQFFLWRPRGHVANERMMDLTTFILLMRDRQAHPQLFDRRELEEAVLKAASKHSGGTEVCLDLPQFVEALVWCSLRLQWTEDTSVPSDLVVILKFLMLIFVMEGKGSMLTKRSQDIDVVMVYLQRQNATKQSDKLRRFQNLLRSEEFNKGPKQTPQQNKNRGHLRNNTKMRVGFELPTHLPSRQQSHHKLHVNEQIPHDVTESLSTDRERKSYQAMQTQKRESHGRQTPRKIDTFDQYRLAVSSVSTAPDQRASVDVYSIDHEQPPATDTGDLHLIGVDESDRRRINREQGNDIYPTGLPTPMSRDTFLDDILSTMNDVELILQHSESRRPSRSTPPLDCEKGMVHLSSEPFSSAYPERNYTLKTGRLPHGKEGESQSESLEEVAIRDPVLDYLTFADRFSESTDWHSTPSIAEIAENGIYAAFPSSMHVVSTLQTGELDDLTSPQPTLAYLRED